MIKELHIPPLNISLPPKILHSWNPSYIEASWTKWHEMANNKNYLPVEQIVELGNPSDCRGLTVADVMIFTGYKFTDTEEKILGIDITNLEYTVFTSFELRDYFKEEPPQPIICPKCGCKLDCLPIEPSKSLQEILDFKILYPMHCYTYRFYCGHCHWWSIRERWAELERGFEGDHLLVGVAKSMSIPTYEDKQPWETALANRLPYSPKLKMPEDLLRMFL